MPTIRVHGKNKPKLEYWNIGMVKMTLCVAIFKEQTGCQSCLCSSSGKTVVHTMYNLATVLAWFIVAMMCGFIYYTYLPAIKSYS